MTYLVTLADYTPAPRSDGYPWTSARIEESAAPGGSFTAIDTIALTPLDADPENPQARTFTTGTGTLESGWYRVVWVDALLAEQATDPVLNAAYRPTVADVADIIPARTSAGGGEAGTFTAATRPSAIRVEALVDDAASLVTAKTGAVLPASVHAIARRVIAIGAAMLVESGARDFNRDRYQALKGMYDDRLKTLVTAVEEAAAGGDPGVADDGAGVPIGSFDVPVRLDWGEPGFPYSQTLTPTPVPWWW